MERGDLLKANAQIFNAQGKALNDNANKNVKVGSFSFLVSITSKTHPL